MPRVLRCSLYATPYREPPVTTITRESDLRVPIQRAAEEMEEVGAGSGFVVTEIFEVDDATYADFPRVCLEASGRLDAHQLAEWNMATSFYYNRDQLQRVTPGGALVNPGRAPLTVGEIETVMLALARCPAYKQQMLVARACDDVIVTFRDGQFTRTDPVKG